MQFFCRTKTPPPHLPTRVEDGSFRLSTRFLEHHPETSSPINQKKVTPQYKFCLQPSTQILPIKTFPPKLWENLGVLNMSHPFSLLSPAINFYLLKKFLKINKVPQSGCLREQPFTLKVEEVEQTLFRSPVCLMVLILCAYIYHFQPNESNKTRICDYTTVSFGEVQWPF